MLLIRIVIEENINHLAPYWFQFAADPAAFRNECWYRQNWMAVEFTLLYLIPSHLSIAGQEEPLDVSFYNTDLLTATCRPALPPSLSA